MRNKLSLSIFIPAYNEEANIQSLLKELLALDTSSVSLERIIVCSDGSTDKTVEKVKELQTRKISIINSKLRLGRAKRQNAIKRNINSDVLLILDADISITDKNFLSKMLAPFRNGSTDLASARVEELPSKTRLSSTLSLSMKLKKTIFERMNNGENIYTCHGRVRAFSKRLYKKITYIHSNGEDAFSYLYCKKHGYKYSFVANTQIWYQLPDSLGDHESQSIRFYKSQTIFKKEFGESFVATAYKIPFSLLLVTSFIFALKHPSLIIYFVGTFLLKLKSLFSAEIRNTWKISPSSKIITR